MQDDLLEIMIEMHTRRKKTCKITGYIVSIMAVIAGLFLVTNIYIHIPYIEDVRKSLCIFQIVGLGYLYAVSLRINFWNRN